MKKEKEFITVKELAVKLGISPRAVHFKLKSGNPIPHVKSYRKVSAGRTCAYIIKPAASFFEPTPAPVYTGHEDFLK